jgi:hypothetical protein
MAGGDICKESLIEELNLGPSIIFCVSGNEISVEES